MYWHKIDISNDVSFMKIVHVVCDSRPKRQYIMNTPVIVRIITYTRLLFIKLNLKIKNMTIPVNDVLYCDCVFQLMIFQLGID